MAVHIVDDVPAGFPGRRLGRGIAVLLGILLVVAAMIAAIVPLLWVEAAVYAVVTHSGSAVDKPSDALYFAALVLIVVLVLWVGLRLIRGRRRLGLYLRKFGFADTTRTVSHALGSAVGRSFRLVTLDDSQVAPLGAGRGRRRLGLLVGLLALGAIGWAGYYLSNGSVGRAADEAANSVPKATDLKDAFGSVLSAGIASAIAAAIVIIVFVTLATIGLVVGALGGSVFFAARRAERAASQTLTDERGVDAAARKLARASRRTLAARLVVVAVPTAFWQRAVHGLAAVSDVVIIDVSRPTENLLWEIRNIKPLFHGRWVLVGARDLVSPLAAPHTAAGHDPTGMLARMLDGERILVYTADPAGRRRFARSLRRALEQVSRQSAQPAVQQPAAI
jgi:hypothetical protein